MSLRDLDERFVPRLAAVVDRVAGWFPKAPEPSGPLPVILRLRRLDDRWTAQGPLALLRDVPQLGAVLIGALVLTNAITVASRNAAERAARPGTGVERDDGIVSDGTVGPDIGEPVPEYLAATKARLRELTPGRPDGMVVAVVILAKYRTPEDVAALLGPVQAREIFYRAPMRLPNGIPRRARVEDLVVDSRREFRQIAARQAAESRALKQQYPTIVGDPEQRDEQRKDSILYETEARLLRGPCACVFAVVVRARLRMLLPMLDDPAIRTVDVSEVGEDFEGLAITALLPEEKVTVTGGNQAGP